MKLITLLIFTSLALNLNAQTNDSNKIELEGDTVKIPFIIIGNWIFIDGEVNEIKGRWMFDTGNNKVISLNSDKLKDITSNETGSGYVGSGQAFKTVQYKTINNIKIGNLQYFSLPDLNGENQNFLYPITTEIIGMIGFGFFKGYDLKIDYLRSELTFFKQKDSNLWKDIKNKKGYITSVSYFTKKQENIPMINITYKGVNYLATFDTGGGNGWFTIEDSNFKKLKTSGDISYSHEDSVPPIFTWHNININKKLKFDLFGLYKMDENAAFKPLGITEKNVFSLDYSFLSKYITIWDTKNKQIHIFENK